MKSRITMPTFAQAGVLRNMLLSHAAEHDLCLVGPRCSGKSYIAHEFAKSLGYATESVLLHRDMTSRDLLMQRTTLSNGDTDWRPSPLIHAVINGNMAILDGVHRVDPSTLAVLQRLAQDRELTMQVN